MSSINPFSYGKPIDEPDRFIGRRREIEQVYSRLLSAFESSSIVGESRMGKTSVLKMLAHPTTQAEFGLDPDKYTFIYQDFQFLGANTKPTRFWQRVLKNIKRAVQDQVDVVDEIDYGLKADTIDNYMLDDIFEIVDGEDLYIVLLLDEFANVTRNENFDDDFFAGLRALAIHHNLALVTSSREELVDLTHSEKVRSSPFFNIFASINLRPFSESEATELIDRYLTGTNVKFLLSELNIVFSMAGYHPYVLQLTCHHLFSAHQQKLNDAARRQYLLEKSRSECDAFFQDYWHSSSSSEQVLLTIMMMRELERVAGEYTVEALERFYTRTAQVMPKLERRNLVIKNPDTSAYHLFSSELREWIADEVVGDVEDLRAWRDWQKGETLVGKLPSNLQGMLAEVVRGLNPAYRETLGNWLLEPATAMPALLLVQTYVSRYEHYKVTRTERTATMVDAEEPVGDTPKGLFERVNQRLAGQEPVAAATVDSDDTIDSLDKQQRDQSIISLKRQLLRYTANRDKLLEEVARYGSRIGAPLKLQNELEEIEDTIAELEDQLDELEQQV